MPICLLAVEWVSRWVEGAATKGAPAEAAAESIYENIVTRYGCPQSLQSDNGTHFVNPIIRALCRILKIRHHLSTPYYPQSNGKIERVVGTVKTMLKRAVQEAAEVGGKEEGDNVLGVGAQVYEGVIEAKREGLQDAPTIEEDPDMEESKAVYCAPILQTVLWAYRCTPRTTIGYSPAMLALGKELGMPFDMSRVGEIDRGKEGEINEYSKPDEEHKESISRRIRWLTEGIPGLRELKVDNVVGAYKELELGQRVWKRESKYDGKGFASVFAPRWTWSFRYPFGMG